MIIVVDSGRVPDDKTIADGRRGVSSVVKGISVSLEDTIRADGGGPIGQHRGTRCVSAASIEIGVTSERTVDEARRRDVVIDPAATAKDVTEEGATLDGRSAP